MVRSSDARSVVRIAELLRQYGAENVSNSGDPTAKMQQGKPETTPPRARGAQPPALADPALHAESGRDARKASDSLKIHGAAAFGRSAPANPYGRIFANSVIRRQLFSLTNSAAAKIEQMPADSPGREIRLARMIDQFRAASPHRAVYNPIAIQLCEVIIFRSATFLQRPFELYSLRPCEQLPGIFDDFLTGRNGFRGKDPLSVYWGSVDAKPIPREPRSDVRFSRCSFMTLHGRWDCKKL